MGPPDSGRVAAPPRPDRTPGPASPPRATPRLPDGGIARITPPVLVVSGDEDPIVKAPAAGQDWPGRCPTAVSSWCIAWDTCPRRPYGRNWSARSASTPPDGQRQTQGVTITAVRNAEPPRGGRCLESEGEGFSAVADRLPWRPARSLRAGFPRRRVASVQGRALRVIPTAPSSCSRRMSACPACRLVSESTWTMMLNSFTWVRPPRHVAGGSMASASIVASACSHTRR